MRVQRNRANLVAVLAMIGAMAPGVFAQDVEPEDMAPGLIAAFSASGEARPIAERVVADLANDWGSAAPDPRVPAADFVVQSKGSLLIQSPGTHRFLARTDGGVVLKVAGKLVLSGRGADLHSTPIDLPPGFTTIDLEYRHANGEARVAIDWEGPGFRREPIPARLFFHDPTKNPAIDRFEDGRRLADRLGCANCHALLDLPAHPNLSPALSDAGRAIDPRWLGAWLADPAKVRPHPRMPAFGLNDREVADLTAFLASLVKKAAPPSGEIKMALNVANPARGRLLFRSLGCLGCHTRGEAFDGDRSAPDLADLGHKRSAEWLALFLEHPRSGKVPARHRPDFRLNADDSAHLAAYLVSDPIPEKNEEPRPEGDVSRGRTLADRLRCASCHVISSLKVRPADRPLGHGSSARAGCLAVEPAAGVPRFALTDDQRAALRALVAGLPARPSPTAAQTLADDTIRRLNCLGCHARDNRGGGELGARIAARLAEDPALGGLKGTLTPPNLTAVGDKLRPEYLDLAVRGHAPTARPWLSVRMPVFPFEAGEAEAILAYLQRHDRMTTEPEPASGPTQPDRATVEHATQLIGQRGFGCVSCHVLAGRIPPGGEPETLGPDLALAHRRMTERYFERWIGNPQRIIAGTPMPQFVKPLATAPGTLDEQLGAIWQLLGSTKVGEVAAFGTREFLKRQGDRALVVRDMILLPGAPDTEFTPRGLAIGLKNGHSLLFDTDRLTWLAWWQGGFVYRTKAARLWEWHPDGERLWTAPERLAPVVLIAKDGTIVPPAEVRERFGSFSELVFVGDGVSLAYTLHGPGSKEIEIVESIRPIERGWDRVVSASKVPEGYRPAVVVPGEKSPIRVEADDDSLLVKGQGPSARMLPMAASGSGQFRGRARYTEDFTTKAQRTLRQHKE